MVCPGCNLQGWVHTPLHHRHHPYYYYKFATALLVRDVVAYVISEFLTALQRLDREWMECGGIVRIMRNIPVLLRHMLDDRHV